MTLLEKVQIIVTNYGAEAMAQELGKPYKTLMRELNPNDEAAKLGLMTFLQIIRISKNISPLHMIAKMFDKIIIDIPSRQNNEEIFGRLASVLTETGNLLAEIGKVTSPNSEGGTMIVGKERITLNDKGYELLQALGCLLACVGK